MSCATGAPAGIVRAAHQLQDYLDMMRLLFAAAALVLLVTGAQAASIADLKAAQAAAEKGTSDEAIRLFTQALAAGDLSADDQVAAHTGRGREYTSKSLIADAFDRHDDGKRLRDNAIADFSAALSAKPDDAALFLDRGQDYHMSGQFDPAIADFSARPQTQTFADHPATACDQPAREGRL